MKQNAVVKSVEPGGRAVLVPLGSEACSSCGGRGGCGLLCPSGKSVEIRVPNTAGAAPGDIVELELPPGPALRMIFLVFILPVLGLGAGLAVHRGGGVLEPLSAVAGFVCGLGVGLALVRRAGGNPESDLRMGSVVSRSPGGMAVEGGSGER